jgi:hypothetical protein
MSKYVLSTMTNAVSYNVYETIADLPRKKAGVLIHGGAHLPSVRSGFGEMQRDVEGTPIWTAAGVVTPVSDSQYDLLKDHPLFKKHLAGGYLKVVNHDITDNHKLVKREVTSMNRVDAHAQLTPDTFKQKVKMKTPMQVEQETAFRI